MLCLGQMRPKLTLSFTALLRVRGQVKIANMRREAFSGLPATMHLFSSQPEYQESRTRSSSPAKVATKGSLEESALSLTGLQASRFTVDGQNQRHAQRTEHLHELIKTVDTERTPVLFPAVKPCPGEKLTVAQAAVKRSGALKLVYRNLLVRAPLI